MQEFYSPRSSLLVLRALAAIFLGATACGKATTDPAGPANASPSGSAVVAHELGMNTGNDDSSLAAWVGGINADCSNAVKATIPKGVITVHSMAFLTIASTCTNPPRSVEVAGAGADSSTLQVASKAYNGSGGFGFLISDPRVHLHDFGIRSLADTTQLPTFNGGSGNSDEGIKLISGAAAGGDGEVDHMRFVNFRTSAVDVDGVPGMSLHDNAVYCAASFAPNYQPSMGLWMRALLSAPASGAMNGSVIHNQVYNCGDSGINLDDANYVTVRDNTVGCTAGDCPQGWFATPKRSVLGIAVWADHSGCGANGASYNVVDSNVVNGSGHIMVGIVLEGSGLGTQNSIMDNVIDSTAQWGIVVSNLTCPGPVPAFTYNTIGYNTIVDGGRAGIMDGGGNDVIEDNKICPSAGAAAVAEASASTVVEQNVESCSAVSTSAYRVARR